MSLTISRSLSVRDALQFVIEELVFERMGIKDGVHIGESEDSR